jgi:hypothetical protein
MPISISTDFPAASAPPSYHPSTSSTTNANAPIDSSPKLVLPPADAVHLSQYGQIHLFKEQGKTPSQIAATLSLPVATVDGYLGIAVTKIASGPPQSSAPSDQTASVKAPASAQAATTGQVTAAPLSGK